MSSNRRPRRAHRRAWSAAALAIVAALAPIVPASAVDAAGVDTSAVDTATADTSAPGILSPETGAYFASILDWRSDSAVDQAARLGSPSAAYERNAPLPLTPDAAVGLETFLDEVADVGALPIITVAPSVDLASIDDRAADDFVADLSGLLESSDTPVYLRFAPDMNTGRVDWGFDPDAYKRAFRAVADAVHGSLPGAVMVWSPAWVGSYPAGLPDDLTGDRAAALDTTHDEFVDGSDDPYGPYYPGDAVTDWIGLEVYHDDSVSAPLATTPGHDELVTRLGGGGGDDPASGFYARFVEETGKPLLLETAALTTPAAGARGETIASAWWNQVFAAVEGDAYPLLDVVLWRDTESTRAVVGDTVVDWGVTLDDSTADAFRADLAASALVVGPVLEEADGADAPEAVTGPSRVVLGAVLLGAAALLIAGLSGIRRHRLVYDGPADRDLRIDLLRGLAVVFVVVDQVGLVSVFTGLTQESIGVVSGAELFVLLSGVVLGMVYRPKAVSGGIGEVVIRATARAGRLYAVSLTLTVAVFLLSLIPFLDTGAVMTFTDRGTGAGSAAGSGRIYDLYPGIGALLGYPVSPQVVSDIALLRLGPWQVGVLGLFVVLMLLAPLVLWALARRGWVVVLLLSAAFYAVGTVLRPRLLPAQFEDSFPLLVWQVLFVFGLVAGYYRREILAWFHGRAGRVALSGVVVLAVLFAAFAWSDPSLAGPADARLALLPENLHRSVYAAYFERPYLGVGRLVNVFLVVIALYALLTAFWRPLHRVLGWFLVPLGQASLYVFVMHLFLIVTVSNIPALGRGDVVLDSVASVVLLALLWVMVKTGFLFALVPRSTTNTPLATSGRRTEQGGRGRIGPASRDRQRERVRV